MTKPAFYIWSSNDGCEACEALRGLHLRPPRRQHRGCKCTITPYYPDDPDGRPHCKYQEHLLLSVATTGEGTSWNEEANQYDSMLVHVEFSVMCKDGSIKEGSYTHEVDVQSDRLPFAGQHDLETFGDSALQAAINRWEEEADRICPGCQ